MVAIGGIVGFGDRDRSLKGGSARKRGQRLSLYSIFREGSKDEEEMLLGKLSLFCYDSKGEGRRKR